MVHYIILFVVIAICSTMNLFISKKKLKYLYLMCIIYLIIFAGFRDGIGGYDVHNYAYYFQQVKPINEIVSLNDIINYRFEVLYTVINSIIKTFTTDYRIVLLVCSIVSITCISIFNYKYSYYPFFSLLYFLYKLFLYGNMVVVRQSIAIGIFLISIKYIKENKFIKYLIFNIFGACFHSSALILIPIFFIRNINFKKIGLVKLSIISGVILLISGPLLRFMSFILGYILPQSIANKLYAYSAYAYFTKTSLLNIVEILGIVILLSIFYKKDNGNNNENIIIKGTYFNFIMVVSFIMFSFVARVNLYFSYFVMISISYIIKYIKNTNIKILVYIMFIFIFFIGFIYDIKTFDAGSMQNYSNWILQFIKL